MELNNESMMKAATAKHPAWERKESHKLTQGEMKLLVTAKEETQTVGKLSAKMAAFLLQTSPQAIGRMVQKLTRRGYVWRDREGSIYYEGGLD